MIPGLEADAKGPGENRRQAEYAYHLFISYARQPDRPLAKRIESFLEGFHRTLRITSPEAGASQASVNARFLRARVVDGSLWVGTKAGLYVLEGGNAKQLISEEATILDIVPAGQKVWIATDRGAYVRDEDGQLYRVTESFRNIRSIRTIGDFVSMLTGKESEPGPALVGTGLRFRPVPGRASRVTGLVEENGDVLLVTSEGTLRFRDGELRRN